MGVVYAAFFDPSIAGSNKTKVIQGGFASGSNMASELQLVALYVKFENPASNVVWQRYQGAEAISCEDNGDGSTIVYDRITSGPNKGARVVVHKAVGAASSPRELEAGTEDVAASGSACWDVYRGGAGGAYTSALSDADSYMDINYGYPG